jgi:CRISPR-associated endoribonuclease Cas6
MKVVYYKDTVIKGWLGKYMLTGDLKLIRLVFSVGIGAKNSQGFGMLEPVI